MSKSGLKFRQRIWFQFGAALSLCSLSILAGPPAHADTLRVAQYENPPTIFRNKNNVPTGFWPELTEEVLGNLNYDVEYVDCLWSVCLEMLEAGEIDLMPDIAFTQERSERFQFVEQPLLYSWFAIVVSKDVSLETLDDFEGKRIAVMANSIQESGVTEHLQQQRVNAQLIWTSSMEGVLDAVSAGDADIGIVNRFIAASEARNKETTYIAQIPFGTYSLHFATSPQMAPGLVDAINLEIYQQQTTFRSAFQHAERRWATIVPIPLPFWVLSAFAIALVLLSLAGVFLLILRRLVAQKTQSLAAAIVDLEHQIDQRKQAEAYALEAQKMDALGRMVGGVAHDFNNLLAVILGNLELMPEHCETDPNYADFRSGAKKATERGATLVRDLLSFGRRASLTPELIAPVDVLNSVHKMSARVLPANISILLPEEAQCWQVKLDRGQLENALLNLALNAKDAMPHGGELTLSCTNVELKSKEGVSGAERLVKFSVRDTGIGMTEDIRAKVCEPFFTTKEVGKGSGMGLAMVHGFVKQSNGSMSITSTPDLGTTIELIFPAAPLSEESLQSSDLSDAPLDRGRGSILLVEDNEMVREVLSRQISSIGYDVQTAATGKEALERLSGDPTFDLVITDIVMPGSIQGTDIAMAVEVMDNKAEVILITGYAGDTLADLATPYKTNVLTKPVSKNDLAAAIRRVLKP
ncbi:transporter substrate-binding domain-containing protein [Pseudophaeobacter sp.]|uniref:ATP-binding protein n=1 Tax=Pseudophaeobacter sp. TaxID=1971739 RepID=UPI003298A631